MLVNKAVGWRDADLYKKPRLNKFQPRLLCTFGAGMGTRTPTREHENLNLACLPIPSCPHFDISEGFYHLKKGKSIMPFGFLVYALNNFSYIPPLYSF